jgi:predicted nucleic acid-binding protein
VITAVDSSVLVAIYKGELDGQAWLEIIQAQGGTGRLVVCEVVFAETAALFADAEGVVRFLQDLDIQYDPIQPTAAIFAGGIFKAYRRSGGPRLHLIPDFLIGSHALHQADQLAAADQGFLRRYFPRLKIIAPR